MSETETARTTKPVEVRKFDSLGAFTRWIQTTPMLPQAHNYGDDSNSRFRGTQSLAETYTLAETGWIDGANQIERLSTPLVSAISSKIERQDIVHDVEGIGIDIARFTDGEPECWQKWEQTTVDGRGNRVLTLVYNFAASAGISHETIIAKGSAIAALVQCLEFAGYRVEVWSVAASSDRNQYTENVCELHTRVKESDQNINMPELAFSLAHPSMLRRLFFAFLERMPLYSVENKIDSNMGSPVETSFQGDIYIGRMMLGEPQWTSKESVQAWITSELKKQGIELQGE